LITNCTISSNTAGFEGGGIFCFHSSPPITNCTISGNTTKYFGGGIFCFSSSSPIITNCTISGNTAGGNGGGISCSYLSSPKVINSILWGDLAGGVPNELKDSISIIYSDIQGGYTGEGNIEVDPLFVDPDAGDYHLRPNSPCIDAGNSNSTINEDKDGVIRPMDGNGDGVAVVDMGAYESPQVFELHLPKGWSMISLPVEPIDRRVKALFPEAQAVFGYSGQNGQYALLDPNSARILNHPGPLTLPQYTHLDPNAALEAGEGYWIYLPEEKPYSLKGLPIERIEIPEAKSGWSLIGACTELSTPSVDQGTIRAIFGFSNKYNFLGPGDSLQPGKGY